MNDPIKKYLDQRADLESRPLVAGPLDGIERVVAIPALAERQELAATLKCLAANPPDQRRRTLVVVVVNNPCPPHCNPDRIEDNRQTLEFLAQAVQGNPPPELEGLRLAYVDASTGDKALPENQGVGLARKIGLDAGLNVLHRNAAPNGLLACLDADTHVEQNYLEALSNHFDRPDAWAAVVGFAHRLEGSPDRRAAILCYELFLRYHVIGLRHANSPYAFHSIGSTMACSPNAYAAVSGMNRRRAGEDFYFLQELAKTGCVKPIQTTTVHPSPRPSWRVPFGTGRRVSRFLERTHDEYLVYHPKTYSILHAWLAVVHAKTAEPAERIMNRAEAIVPALADFLQAQRFSETWTKLQQNAPDKTRFLAQFHCWFDAFKTLKLIHHLRDNGYPQQDLFDSLYTLLKKRGPDTTPRSTRGLHENLDHQEELLTHLRTIT